MKKCLHVSVLSNVQHVLLQVFIEHAQNAAGRLNLFCKNFPFICFVLMKISIFNIKIRKVNLCKKSKSLKSKTCLKKWKKSKMAIIKFDTKKQKWSNLLYLRPDGSADTSGTLGSTAWRRGAGNRGVRPRTRCWRDPRPQWRTSKSLFLSFRLRPANLSIFFVKFSFWI